CRPYLANYDDSTLAGSQSDHSQSAITHQCGLQACSSAWTRPPADGRGRPASFSYRYRSQGDHRRQTQLRRAERLDRRRLIFRRHRSVMTAETILNRKALRDFHILERYEAGIELKGSEVKSIRAGKANISDAFARTEKGEAFLYNADIQPYERASHE